MSNSTPVPRGGSQAVRVLLVDDRPENLMALDVRLERVVSEVQLKVSDTGQGITQDFLPYVFDRFRQEEGGTTRQQGGLGLGLALVRHLVEAHGGSVRAESEGLGKGASSSSRCPFQPLARRV